MWTVFRLYENECFSYLRICFTLRFKVAVSYITPCVFLQSGWLCGAAALNVWLTEEFRLIVFQIPFGQKPLALSH